jgi:hypothetical protein
MLGGILAEENTRYQIESQVLSEVLNKPSEQVITFSMAF